MLILFEHGTPRGIAGALSGHTVVTAYAKGWDRLTNGALLRTAEQSGVDLLLTTDRRIRYQQNLTNRKIAIVVIIGTTKWSQVGFHFERIAIAITAATPGSYAEVEIPFSYIHSVTPGQSAGAQSARWRSSTRSG
jgi:hypothetical protein